VRDDLSVQAKQTFQVVAFLATILVVGIHYQSDVPDGPNVSAATWNELAQEFMFGGIARVAVPLFAFASGFFYFRSDDGSWACYRRKLRQRARTVAVPYFVVASLATAAWLLVGRLEGRSTELGIGEFLSVWWLHPPAEQLWFLRDLLVLVLVAPWVRWLIQDRIRQRFTVAVLGMVWWMGWQCTPILAGWHLLHAETLFFFTLGGIAAASRFNWDRLGQQRPAVLLFSWVAWCALLVCRIQLKPDFDLWYTANFGITDLFLQRASILLGCVTVFMTSWHLRVPQVLRWSGASFFVYLVHEFPLRAIVERCGEQVMPKAVACWVLWPSVVVMCFAAAMVCSRMIPTLFALLTGGRMPSDHVTSDHVTSEHVTSEHANGVIDFPRPATRVASRVRGS